MTPIAIQSQPPNTGVFAAVVVFAAVPSQVRMIQYGGIFKSNLGIICGGRRWDLDGIKRIFKPWPVIAALQSATAAKIAV